MGGLGTRAARERSMYGSLVSTPNNACQPNRTPSPPQAPANPDMPGSTWRASWRARPQPAFTWASPGFRQTPGSRRGSPHLPHARPNTSLPACARLQRSTHLSTQVRRAR